MRILVTGANGYMGYGIIRELSKSNNEIIATDINMDNFPNYNNISVVETDLFSINNPYEYFYKPDVMLHLAWQKGFNHNDIDHINNLPRHMALIESMCSKGLNRLCCLGSMHEIGFYEGCINENTPANPLNYYGISKNALRNICDYICKKNNVKFQWIRGYYIVGNSERGASIFAKLFLADKEGKEKFPFTDGIIQYDFLDYDMFCVQVAAVSKQDEIDGIINCCSGMPEQIGRRVERFIEDNNLSIKLEYGVFPKRPYDSTAIWGDNKKINNIMRNEVHK